MGNDPAVGGSGQLKTFHDVTPALNHTNKARVLHPYLTSFETKVQQFGKSRDDAGTLSYDDAIDLLFNGRNKAREGCLQHMMTTLVDTNGDSRISAEEYASFVYKSDHLRDFDDKALGNGNGQLDEAELFWVGLGINGAAYLHHEAQKHTNAHTAETVKQRLASGDYDLSKPKLNEHLDLLNTQPQHIDKLAETTRQYLQSTESTRAPVGQQNVQKNHLLTQLAYDKQLPFAQYDDKKNQWTMFETHIDTPSDDPYQVDVVQSQTTATIGNNPNTPKTLTFTDTTDVTRTQYTYSPPSIYTSSGEPILTELQAKFDHILAQPQVKAAIAQLESTTDFGNSEEIERLLGPITQAIQHELGLTYDLEVIKEPAHTRYFGVHKGNDNSVAINIGDGGFAGHKKELSQSGLDEAEQQRQVAHRMLNTLFHESTHAYQHKLIEQLYQGDSSLLSPNIPLAYIERIADYDKNHLRYTSPMESLILTGTQHMYRHGALEADATALGRYVENRLNTPVSSVA